MFYCSTYRQAHCRLVGSEPLPLSAGPSCSAFHCWDTPQVFLDPLLPPLAAAAESHPARSVRVAACEALHAITLWMVGTNARRPLAASSAGGGEGAGVDGAAEQVEPTPFHKVYENLFPVLLR